MVKIVQISNNLACDIEHIIADLGFASKKVLLVSDDNIFNNAETFFAGKLDLICHEKLILDNPKADDNFLQKVKQAVKGVDLILALGSGTISDLCKLTSAQENIPYIIFASAPSMNGYVSKNASITMNGHKKTVPATLPLAVFCDLGILKTAPERLIKAGIGDSLCFYSCWFDWYLSHLVLATPFDESLFRMLEGNMRLLVEDYARFSLTDDALLKLLMEILLLSGESMTKAGGSYPASQSEHLIAHVLDMKYPAQSQTILHGQHIAITTLTSAERQEALLQKEQLIFMIDDDESKLVEYFGQMVADQCLQEYHVKKDMMEKAVCDDWENNRKKLSELLFRKDDLLKILQHFDIKTSYDSFGISQEQYLEAVSYAKFIRNRFTCLDVRN